MINNKKRKNIKNKKLNNQFKNEKKKIQRHIL